MAPYSDEFSEETLHGYLTGAAVDRGERFVVEERGGEWVAEFRGESGLGGETVMMGSDAVILPDEAVRLRANGPDRRTAMARLADVVATDV